jgi:hypothetical protein
MSAGIKQIQTHLAKLLWSYNVSIGLARYYGTTETFGDFYYSWTEGFNLFRILDGDKFLYIYCGDDGGIYKFNEKAIQEPDLDWYREKTPIVLRALKRL